MDIVIERIKITNYKRFREFDAKFGDTINLLIGDNESGKSTILSAVDVVLSGSKRKVEGIGLNKMFNRDVIHEFLKTQKKYSDLPQLKIELFLNDHKNRDLDGYNNSEEIEAHGLKLTCRPNEQYEEPIKEILNQKEPNFPFEFYYIDFETFQGGKYSGYNKYVSHLLLDSTQINSDYAIRNYISDNYNNWIDGSESNRHENEYRRYKDQFTDTVLADLNQRIEDNFSFSLKHDSKSNLENDLTITQDGIPLENQGKGKQCFVKTDFALQKRENPLDIVLLEEPENHLSHLNMKRLIKKIQDAENKQLIIATHSNLICSRLDLRNAILLNSNSQEKLLLDELSEETAKFFIKAPHNNILEFILSKKVILVEGHSEYILMEAMFKNFIDQEIENSEIHVISVGGTSFPRYLEIANLLDIKTAVICDNDGNFESNCKDRFTQYEENKNINVFYVEDNSLQTFEVVIYDKNKDICDNLFLENRRTQTVKEYMLSNKTEAAFQLLDKKSEQIITPDYIKRAIEWINQ